MHITLIHAARQWRRRSGRGRTGVGHGEDARAGVAELEILVLELEAVDALAAGAVACMPTPGPIHEMLVLVWGLQPQRRVQIRDGFGAPPRRATREAATQAQTQIQAAGAALCVHVERCERHRWGDPLPSDSRARPFHRSLLQHLAGCVTGGEYLLDR